MLSNFLEQIIVKNRQEIFAWTWKNVGYYSWCVNGLIILRDWNSESGIGDPLLGAINRRLALIKRTFTRTS